MAQLKLLNREYMDYNKAMVLATIFLTWDTQYSSRFSMIYETHH